VECNGTIEVLDRASYLSGRFGMEANATMIDAEELIKIATITEVSAKLVAGFLNEKVTKVQLRKHVQQKLGILQAMDLDETALHLSLKKRCDLAWNLR
jgi:hypothetical protein